jgi:3'-phosphoadenosine 5'-phosphosulfate sulfotransferase (PAPS reductase)/FAD synthetase
VADELSMKSDMKGAVHPMALTALAFSGGKDAMACLHLMRDQLDCAIHVDTGMYLPETRQCVNYAASLVPMHIVTTDRKGQNEREGFPADVVPIDWTGTGQEFRTKKPVTIQSYLGCCFENRMGPLWEKAKSLGVTRLVSGTRSQDGGNPAIHNGLTFDGIERIHPIEGWTDQEVLEYLETKMAVPDHYYQVVNQSSLDCYDCTAFRLKSQDRIAWMRTQHTEAYAQYKVRMDAVDAAVADALFGTVKRSDHQTKHTEVGAYDTRNGTTRR